MTNKLLIKYYILHLIVLFTYNIYTMQFDITQDLSNTVINPENILEQTRINDISVDLDILEKPSNNSNLEDKTKFNTDKSHNDTLYKYICENCDYRTNIKNHFESHIKRHNNDHIYSSTTESNNLSIIPEYQDNQHHEEQYKCNFNNCHYVTKNKNYLRRHIKKHNNYKPYKCKSCDYSAENISTLKIHMTRHSKHRPYKCEFCDYSAKLKGTLKIHMKKHSDNKPHKCTFKDCKYATKYPQSLKRHIISKHKSKSTKLDTKSENSDTINNSLTDPDINSTININLLANTNPTEPDQIDSQDNLTTAYIEHAHHNTCDFTPDDIATNSNTYDTMLYALLNYNSAYYRNISNDLEDLEDLEHYFNIDIDIVTNSKQNIIAGNYIY